jgi:beta-lactamase regulating signal transducer with metallopeptidase domain
VSPVPAQVGIEAVLQFVAEHGAMLLAGVTAMLGAGAAAVRFQRTPIQRQRLGELTVACTLLWLVLACVPLPRFHWNELPAAPAAPTTPFAARARPLRARTIPAPETRPTSPLYFATAEPAWRDDQRAHGPAEAPAQPAVIDRSAEPALIPTEFTAATSPTTPSVAASAPPPADPRRIAAAVFLSGATVCSAWLLLGGALLTRLIRRSAAAPAWLRELLDALDSARRPRLLVSGDCPRPISCGVLRPTILLPARTVHPDNALQLRQVLLHELAHVRQRDAWGNALFNLAMPLLYAHPLYWLLRRDVHLARELVADDWAAARSDKAAYVQELVAMARSSLRPGAWAAGPVGQVALFRSSTNFYRRMHMLMQRQESLATACSPAWRLGTFATFALAMAIGAGALGRQPARAQESPDKPKPADAQDVDKLKQQLLDARKELDLTMKRLQSLQAEAKSAQDQQAQREVALRQHLEQLSLEQNELQALKARADRDRVENNLRLNEKSAQDPLAKRNGNTPNVLGDIPARRDAGNNALAYALGSGSGQLDLVALALSYVDAAGEVRASRARLERTVKLAQNKNATATEVDLDKAALESADRKVQLLRGIVEIVLKGSMDELRRTEELVTQGAVSNAQVSEVRTKVQILELILKSGQ